MRKLVITENITLDGVIQATGGWFDPAGTDEDIDQSDLVAALGRQSAAADGFLVGRITFEEMRGFWPQQVDDTAGVSDYLNRVSKYVVSTTMSDPQWTHSTVLSGDVVREVTELKSQPGADIVTTGSITLTRTLIAEGLVDEYRLFVYPVVVGTGRRLFGEGSTVPPLRLIECQPFHSGIVLLTYQPA